jgi:TPR repeat protein
MMMMQQSYKPTTTMQLAYSSSSSSAGDSDTTTTGDELYQQAMLAFEKAKTFQQEIEDKRNRQQYEAWQKSNEVNSPSSKKGSTIRGGVAVVRTIVKQTKKKNTKTDTEKEQGLLQTAQSLLEEAALKYGHPTALVRLGNAALEEEENGEAKAMDYYQRANSPEGWFNLGHLLWNAENGEGNYTASMEAFQKAIKLGDADAMYFVGVQYLSQEDDDAPTALQQTHQDGLNLIQKAADQGHGGALHYVALFYLQGSTVLSIDPGTSTSDEFIKLLDAAAEAGDEEALFLRGHGYYHGEDGRPQDYIKALENFLRAADAGHADAAISAGAMMHQGIGGNVRKDQQRAFELYQLAGELGSKEGWRNVVACYALGEGVPKSKETAEYIAKTMLLDDDPV